MSTLANGVEKGLNMGSSPSVTAWSVVPGKKAYSACKEH
jgi:hypothetical protein